MARLRKALILRLAALEGGDGEGEGGSEGIEARGGERVMEFHVSRKARLELGFEASLFQSTGNVVIPDFREARILARRINERIGAALIPEKAVRAGKLNAMGLIDEILHDVARLYRERVDAAAFADCLLSLEKELGAEKLDGILFHFVEDFPPLAVLRGEADPGDWLAERARGADTGDRPAPSNREVALEELLLLRLANENPAFSPFLFLFDDGSPGNAEGRKEAEGLAALPGWTEAFAAIDGHFARLPRFGPDDEDLLSMLRAPMRAAPYSLSGQLDFIRKRWGLLIGDKLLRLLGGLDLMREEEKPFFPGPGPTRALVYSGMEREYERFSPDRDWMPNVVMIAKSTLVWLDQLSRRHGREIRRLDQIPDDELDLLASRGVNALWLIGLWERSRASAEIKRRCGNPEAASSAYSLFDYEIADELGGWGALEELRRKAWLRGIRLAADMVPNHTGLDSAWLRERPELFMRSPDCPFPSYSFSGGNLSEDGRMGVWLEDHYYDRTDAAVVFKRVDFASGRVDYVYHGNDGTGLPWSDTAQLDFLNPATREAVKERILHVARNFPIIRFDAAMVLARKHFRRLWYPEPGHGGDVPSRAGHALAEADFETAMPEEFFREVVDLCARETPDTLLLAEAFWMMEGYFVRTLGMHRVYNSAFMNMLKREENAKYRETIRNTQEFDREILKRFVNFMNNPDEETAIAQFGNGDKYFGVCTMMATMPGLPMFGHGQVEGLTEKYGMEYRRAYVAEEADRDLVARHEREVFPLLRRRHLFSGVEDFLLYDFVRPDGTVDENVFAYSNRSGSELALVAYNNAYPRAEGRIRDSAPFAVKSGGGKHLARRSLGQALGLSGGEGRYLAAREQRSGLWFLRRSDEILESGLHLMLDGYQCQVFLEIFEATDDGRGLYGELFASLGGRGVPDLSEALEDVARKELYALLAAYLPSAFFVRLRASFEAASAGRAAAGDSRAAKTGGEGSRDDFRISDEAAEAGFRLYVATLGLLREGASEEGLGPGEPEAGSKAARRADEASALRALGRFQEGLARLRLVAERGGKEGGLPSAWLRREGGLESLVAFLFLESLRELVPAGPRALEGRRLAERLAFGRKLREALQGAGVSGQVAHHGMALAALFAGSEAWIGEGAGLLPLFSAMEADEEIGSSLGVNVWDGTTWFKREAFADFLDFGLAATLLRGARESSRREGLEEEFERRLGILEAEAAALREAERLSEYRVGDFLAALPTGGRGAAGPAKGNPRP